jgi:hypothetical protein
MLQTVRPKRQRVPVRRLIPTRRYASALLTPCTINQTNRRCFSDSPRLGRRRRPCPIATSAYARCCDDHWNPPLPKRGQDSRAVDTAHPPVDAHAIVAQRCASSSGLNPTPREVGPTTSVTPGPLRVDIATYAPRTASRSSTTSWLRLATPTHETQMWVLRFPMAYLPARRRDLLGRVPWIS